MVAASYAPGAVVTDVARRHDVHPNLLHHWRRQAKRAAEAGGGLKLLPVTVTAPTNRAAVSGSIEIELGGAVRVRVDAAVDEAALGRVLRALRR
jgi:transposase